MGRWITACGIALFCLESLASAACQILGSTGKPVPPAKDILSRLVTSASVCPTDVFEFRELLKQSRFSFRTALVANEGFHNPARGSLSIFEFVLPPPDENPPVSMGSDLFFGHFTAVGPGNQLVPHQSPHRNSLMVEALAWDEKKGFYNFYELRGDGSQGQWFYRGDSADILKDIQLLHRQPDPDRPRFGNRLRCSACHLSGGPIMKELSLPHNDWWEPKRGLDLGGRTLSKSLSSILKSRVPAEDLSKAVQQGLFRLEQSPAFQKVKATRSLQEQLRPLFCPEEINLESDPHPYEQAHPTIKIPINFFIDPQLLGKHPSPELSISRLHYQSALEKIGSTFPGTRNPDADHAWLTPVKALSDRIAIHGLVEKAMIDEEFAVAVLAIDFTRPLFSNKRCGLLRYLPDEPSVNWRSIFIDRLRAASSPAARELIKNLTGSGRNRAFHQKRVLSYLQKCQAKMADPEQVFRLVALLFQRRKEIHSSEISANPNGQILEPGFRVIFPKASLGILPNASSGFFKLTEEGEVLGSAQPY